MISTSAGSRGRIVAGSCTACGNAMQCPFEAIPPCFSKCTCTVGASLAISICSASDMSDKISGTAIGSMLFSPDQTFGALLSLRQRVHMFLVPLHSSRRSLQTSQKLNALVICSTSNARIALYAISSC